MITGHTADTVPDSGGDSQGRHIQSQHLHIVPRQCKRNRHTAEVR
jgi:hypothetical protein